MIITRRNMGVCVFFYLLEKYTLYICTDAALTCFLMSKASFFMTRGGLPFLLVIHLSMIFECFLGVLLSQVS